MTNNTQIGVVIGGIISAMFAIFIGIYLLIEVPEESSIGWAAILLGLFVLFGILAKMMRQG